MFAIVTRSPSALRSDTMPELPAAAGTPLIVSAPITSVEVMSMSSVVVPVGATTTPARSLASWLAGVLLCTVLSFA